MTESTINELEYGLFTVINGRALITNTTEATIPDIDVTAEGDINDIRHGAFDGSGQLRIALTS